MKSRMLIAACIAASLACSLAAAQSAPSTSAGAMPMRGNAMQGTIDAMFMKSASAANLAEVALGQLALSQGTNSDTRAFAQRMISDHTAANKQLGAIAGNQSILVSQAPSSDEQATYDRLKGLQGDTFDHSYDKQAVKDHQDAINLFNQEIDQGTNPALRNFALKTLPTLREHLSMALRLPQG